MGNPSRMPIVFVYNKFIIYNETMGFFDLK